MCRKQPETESSGRRYFRNAVERKECFRKQAHDQRDHTDNTQDQQHTSENKHADADDFPGAAVDAGQRPGGTLYARDRHADEDQAETADPVDSTSGFAEYVKEDLQHDYALKCHHAAVGGVYAARPEDLYGILHAKLCIAALEDLCLSVKISDTECASDDVCNGGSVARSRDAHVKHADKQQVQHEINASFRNGMYGQDF